MGLETHFYGRYDQLAPANHPLLFGWAGDATWAELGHTPDLKQFAPEPIIAIPVGKVDEIQEKSA